MSGQVSSSSSAYNQVVQSETSEEDSGDSIVEILEHSHSEAPRQQLLSYSGENLPSFPMDRPLFRDPDNPMEEQPDESLDHLSDNYTAGGAQKSRRALLPVSTKSSVHMCIVPLSALIPTVALAFWLVVASKTDQTFLSLAGSEIGGHFTQTQAKEVDFVCSALLAPLLFAGLNLLWFACARVCAVNESARSVPLHTLATASTLSRGTYDPLQYYTLLRGRTWRLAALGGIALCSALGSSALGNMIAYEVFHEDVESKNEFGLRLLCDATIESAITPPESATTPASYGFSDSEFTITAQRVADVLHGLDFVPATLDKDNGYIGVNTTSASMTTLDKSVNELSDVPGYRLSAECVPITVNSVQVWPATKRYVAISPNITIQGAMDAGGVSQ